MALDGQVAVVTGASSGIGAATARALAEAGVRLVLTGRRPDRLAAAARGLPQVATLAGDLLDAGLFPRLLDLAEERFGRLDIVVNNAGELIAGPVGEIDLERLDRMVRVNVEAAFRVAHLAVRRLRARGGGQLVNLSSILGTKVRTTAGAYAGTKYALEALSEALRIELAGTGVKVSCIEPGLVMTELHRALPVHPQAALGVREPLLPDDIARVIVWVLQQPAHVLIPRVMVLAADQPL